VSGIKGLYKIELMDGIKYIIFDFVVRTYNAAKATDTADKRVWAML
jgi:hypothetical protein